MFELLALVSFIAAAVLIWKRSDVPASQRAKWSALAFVGMLLPSVLLGVLDAAMPRFPERLILVPFVIVAELAAPWISLAVFNERFPKPEATEQAEP